MPKIRVEKIIKADRELVFNTITDFAKLPNRLPKYFNAVKIIESSEDSVTTEENIKIRGKDMVQTTKHILKSPVKHEAFVITGEARDSHIVEMYESVPEGTKITIEGDIKLAGKLKVLGLFAKGKLEDRLEKLMDEFAKIVEQS